MQLKRSREHVLGRDAEPLRRKLEAYALQAEMHLTTLYEQEPDEGYWPQMENREAEIWGPLLIHARLAGPKAEARLLAACALLSQQKVDIQEQEYGRALTIELYEAIAQHQEERFTPADLLAYLDAAERWGAKLSKYKEDDIKSKSSAIGRFLGTFRLKSKDRGRVGASNKVTSYLKREALDVLSAHTAQMSATSATLPQAFSTAFASPREATHLDANHDDPEFVADVVADAKNIKDDLPQQSDDTESLLLWQTEKRSATLSATNSSPSKESQLDARCGSVADVADKSEVSGERTPATTAQPVHIADLDCTIHGRHTQWWIEILPDGGEMVCAKCRPESRRKTPKTMSEA
jgi:hypothetical protein